MQLKYRNHLYTVATNPTVAPAEILQGTYRGLSTAINVMQPISKPQVQKSEQIIQYRGIKTHLSFA